MEVKLGIWVGKFESSGNKEQIKIIANTNSLRTISVGDIFTSCQGVSNTYNLTYDSHMMKNIEWGAVAYLAESKYGRNGAEIEMNNSNIATGGGDYISNTRQSTTGNIYGIYDMSGTLYEYVAGVLDSKLSNGSYYDFTDSDTKYYNIYASYNESKKIKGDGVYEISEINSDSTRWWYQDWHQGESGFVDSNRPVFARGRLLQHHRCKYL